MCQLYNSTDEPTRNKVAPPLQQTFEYMKKNELRYAVLTSGEVFTFMYCDGDRLHIADVQKVS